MSDALKRRCIYLYLDFPEIDREALILRNHIEGLDKDESEKIASLASYIRKLNIQKPPSIAEVIDWLRYVWSRNYNLKENNLERNIGILITDHDVQATLAITDRTYLMYQGGILKEGIPEDLAKDELVRKVYLGKDFELKRKKVF